MENPHGAKTTKLRIFQFKENGKAVHQMLSGAKIYRRQLKKRRMKPKIHSSSEDSSLTIAVASTVTTVD